VLGVEYPGYGMYKGIPSEDQIIKDAIHIYDYLINNLNIKEENIVVFGRSIGSGPASYLAANRNPGVIILMSPFTSLRNVVQNLTGKLLSYAVKERFKNLSLMKRVKCPAFFIHGMADKLIPYK
jgi:acetyl esterase/lipase